MDDEARIKALEAKMESLLSKIEDMEHMQLNIPTALVELTPSHTLEDVKGRVNQIISIVNQFSVN